jgi:hypothetical protein
MPSRLSAGCRRYSAWVVLSRAMLRRASLVTLFLTFMLINLPMEAARCACRRGVAS